MEKESPLKRSIQATETVRTILLICAVLLLKKKRYEITVLGVVKARKSGITDLSRDPNTFRRAVKQFDAVYRR